MKINKLALAKKQLEQIKKQGVRVRFSACGKVMIDSLPFSFSVSSAGDASNKGIVVSFSGEPVENGSLVLNTIDMHYTRNGRAHSQTKKLARIVKSDGKHIYQAKFTDAVLESASSSKKKKSPEDLLADIASAYTFKTVPEYRSAEDAEVMVTVYPIADPLTGLAVEWRDCTSDKDWFEHHPDAFTAPPKRRFR